MAADLPVTLSFPAQWLLTLMPPAVRFDCPVQRSKDESEAWWHIPISVKPRLGRIGPQTLPITSAFIHLYDGPSVSNLLTMKWGDAAFQIPNEFRDVVNLEHGRTFLVPVALRSESGNDLHAYITDRGFFRGEATRTALESDRRKRRFKLGVQYGNRRVVSEHFYLVRVPRGPSNSNFSVEREYEGAGTDPLVD